MDVLYSRKNDCFVVETRTRGEKEGEYHRARFDYSSIEPVKLFVQGDKTLVSVLYSFN